MLRLTLALLLFVGLVVSEVHRRAPEAPSASPVALASAPR
jgi:hypothetical protein